MLLPYTKVYCKLGYACPYCDVYYDIQKNKRSSVPADEPLMTWRDALKMTPKANGSNFYHRTVILKPEAMARLGIKNTLINQIFYCEGGSGVFACNPAGMIDGFLVADRNERHTITRHDVFGVPNELAVERYFDLYGINIEWEVEKMK